MRISPKTPQRILIIRTDRIGDVVLTTPILKTLKGHFPKVHLSFLCTPYTEKLVQNNPSINEVIIYDKKWGFLKTFFFILKLRKKRFDVSIVFNPRLRFHLISYLANIPIRIGYNKKGGYLLTHTLEDKKGEGKQSEAFYNEELLSFLNVPLLHSRNQYVPLREESERKVNLLLATFKVQPSYMVMNVSSSCPSRSWPLQNYASLCSLIYQNLALPIVLIGKEKECQLVQKITSAPVISLSETLNLSELTILLKKASLHISTDTGPMHIASAMGTPTIVIFGRNAIGVGPTRWAPLQGNNTILQKDIGCNPCLAEQCKIDFDCLKATKVEEVFNAVSTYAPHFNC